MPSCAGPHLRHNLGRHVAQLMLAMSIRALVAIRARPRPPPAASGCGMVSPEGAQSSNGVLKCCRRLTRRRAACAAGAPGLPLCCAPPPPPLRCPACALIADACLEEDIGGAAATGCIHQHLRELRRRHGAGRQGAHWRHHGPHGPHHHLHGHPLHARHALQGDGGWEERGAGPGVGCKRRRSGWAGPGRHRDGACTTLAARPRLLLTCIIISGCIPACQGTPPACSGVPTRPQAPGTACCSGCAMQARAETCVVS